MERIKNMLTGLSAKCYRTNAPPGSKPPYTVYDRDGANDFVTGGRHVEKAAEGTIDLYTANPDDPLKDQIESGLDDLAGMTTIEWYLNSVQNETEAGTPSSGYTGLIHFEWVFQIGG